MAQALGGWRGQRGCEATSSLGIMRALATLTGAAFAVVPTDENTRAVEFWLPS